MNMNLYPTRIDRHGADRIVIEWSDGQRREYPVQELRDHCPCATCRERPEPDPLALPVLTPADLKPLLILGMRPVGNYGYKIDFSDGHATGIYTFELLRALGKAV